jgi:hypothetical protein
VDFNIIGYSCEIERAVYFFSGIKVASWTTPSLLDLLHQELHHPKASSKYYNPL